MRYLLDNQGDVEVIGEAVDGRQAVKLADELNADIVIMDIGMPLLNGIDAAGAITAGGVMYEARRFGRVIRDGAPWRDVPADGTEREACR